MLTLNVDHCFSHLFRTGHKTKGTDGKEHLQGPKNHKRTHEATWRETTQFKGVVLQKLLLHGSRSI